MRVITLVAAALCMASSVAANGIDDDQRQRARTFVESRKTVSQLEMRTKIRSSFAQWRKPSDGLRGLADHQPSLRPDSDYKYWTLLDSITYWVGGSSVAVVVPAGFVTDLASIPQALWSLGLTPTQKYSLPAIVHDYLYWTQQCTRDQSDRLLVIAMKEMGVSESNLNIVFQGVQIGGGRAWAANAKERTAGLPRVVPDVYRRPPAKRSWEEHRKILVSEGVRDPEPSQKKDYCQLGNSMDVPGMGTSTHGLSKSPSGPLIVPNEFIYDMHQPGRILDLHRIE